MRGLSRVASETTGPSIVRRPPASAGSILAGALVWLALAWGAVLVSDGLDLLGWRAHLQEPLWQTLFLNRRPTEWLQWVGLAATYGGAWYLAARIHGDGDAGHRRFLLWLGLGAALMLIEDAGDVRHIIALYVRRAVDDALVLGLHPATLVDIPYFTVLAGPLIYALVRYGRSVWEVSGSRPYLALGYASYGFAGAGSALSGVGGGRAESSVYLGSLYERIGRTIEALLPGSEHMAGGLEPAHFRFLLADGPVEESLELVGVACLLSVVVALARWYADDDRELAAAPVSDP